MALTPLLFCLSATTGECPAEWIGLEFGGRPEFSLRDWQHSGAGLDAPSLLPSGAHTNRNFDEVPVSTYVKR